MPSATQFIAGLFAPNSGVFRYLGPQGDEQTYDIEAQDLALGAGEVRTVFERDGLRISATPVIHANTFRVEAQGKSIVFSGDGNGDNGNLEKIGAGANLLVAHLAIDDGIHLGARKLHAPPALIGKIAARAKVERPVLSHRRPETLGKEERLQKAATQTTSTALRCAAERNGRAYSPTAARSSAALSVFSQENSGSSRPKCP